MLFLPLFLNKYENDYGMAMENFRHNKLAFEPEDLSMLYQYFNLKTGLMSKPVMVHT
jgi:hypothetical protein